MILNIPAEKSPLERGRGVSELQTRQTCFYLSGKASKFKRKSTSEELPSML